LKGFDITTDPLVTQVNHSVLNVWTGSFGKYMDTAFLDTIKCPYTSPNKEATPTLHETLSCLFRENFKQDEIVNALTRDYWPSLRLGSLIRKLQGLTDWMDTDVTMKNDGLETTLTISSAGIWNKLEERLTPLSIASSLFLLASTFVGDTPSPVVVDARISPILEKLVLKLRKTIDDVADAITEDSEEVAVALIGLSPVLDLSAATFISWMHRAGTVCNEFARAMFAEFLDYTLNDTTQIHVPNYGHIIEDHTWHRPLAKKQLLGFAHRELLEEKTTQLYHTITNLACLHKTWNLTPALEQDMEFKASVSSIRTVYNTARKALVAISACNVILVLTGNTQAKQADEMLTNNLADIPKVLEGELRKLI